MKRILITVGGYSPGKKYGGPVTSITNFVSLLHDDFDFYIVTSNHELHSRKPYEGINCDWNVVGYAKVKYLTDLELSSISVLLSIIRDIKPDVIYHNGLYDYRITIPISILSRMANIPQIIFVPRGDLGPVFPERKHFLKKIYVVLISILLNKKNVYFQATSQTEEQDIIKKMGFKKERIFLIGNIPSTSPNAQPLIRKEPGELKIIYLARIHPTKNLYGALKALIGVVGKVEFNIFGSIEDEEYWLKCQELIGLLPEGIEVSYQGIANHKDVHHFFSLHHALFFPTRNTENYGHTIVESIISERPVIISDQSPWNDIVAYNAGWVFPGDATENYTNVLQIMVNMNTIQYNDLVENVKTYKRTKFSLDNLKIQYSRMLREVI